MPLAVTPCLVMCVRQAKQQWCCGGGSRLLVLFPFGVAHELVELFVEVLVTGMAPTVTVCASLLDRVRGVRPPTLSLSVTTCRGLYFTNSNQAFKGAELARWDPRDSRRSQTENDEPPNFRDPLPDRVVNNVPHTPVSLDPELFAQVLRSSRRGAAASPSGMMAEHLRLMPESTEDTELLALFADTFAKGGVPQEIVDAIRMGRMIALRKLDGGFRGIMVGDLFRRLVSRTLAQQVRRHSPVSERTQNTCRV